jgi:hypothetical protein
MTLETIRRITITAITKGFAEARAQMRGLKNDQDAIAKSSEKQSKATLSVANALDRQKRSLDSAYRAQQDFNKSQQVLDRGLQQGLLNQKEHERYLGLARKRMEEAAQGTTNMQRAMDRLANSLTRRFIFAVLINEMRDVVTWAAKLPSVLASLGSSARRLGIGATDLQGYEGAALSKGIDTTQFLAGAQGLAAALNEAKTNANDLWRLFQLNGGQVRSFEEAMLRVADMVKNARTEQDKFNILQQASLPASAEWVKFMEQGADQIRQQAAEFKKYASDNAMISQAQRFDDAWKIAWANFSLYARSGAGSAVSLLQSTYNFLDRSFQQYLAWRNDASNGNSDEFKRRNFSTSLFGGRDKFSNPGVGNVLGQGAAVPTVDAKAAQERLNVERQRIGLMGELASVTDQVRAKEIELNLAGMNGVSVSKERMALIMDLARVRAEEADTAIRASNGVVTAEQLRIVKEKELAVLVRANKLTQDEANISLQSYNRIIQETIDRQKVLNAQLPGLKQMEVDAGNARKNIDELATTSLNGLSSSITDGIMRTRTWGDAFRNFAQIALRALTDLIVKMTIVQPMAAALQNSFGGGLLSFLSPGVSAGTSIGGLAGIAHTGGVVGQLSNYRNIHPAYFDDAPRFHSGGIVGNERPIIAQVGEEVLRRDDPRHRWNGTGGGNKTININVNVEGANGDQHVIDLVQQGVQQGLTSYDKGLPDRMKQVNQNPRRR